MKFCLKKRLAWIALLFISINQLVIADVLPGPALPEQVSEALTNQQPTPKPKAPPTLTEPPEKKPVASPEAEKIKFQLNGIILEGNKTYSNRQLEVFYQDKMGKTITVAELFNIVQSITNFYRNQGYVISRAILPPQRVANGIVRIQVIEGFIDKINVDGTPRRAKRLIYAFGERIQSERPLQLQHMEKYLFLANEIPGTHVEAVLSPSKTTPAAADLVLTAKSKVITGYFSYDDYGSRYIGPQQITGNVALNSLLASGDMLQGTVIKTPRGIELTYVDVNYNLAMNAEGMRWLIGMIDTRTHPLFVLEPTVINGQNNNYYTNFQFPILRTRDQSLTLRAGFNYLDSNVTFTDQNLKLYTDHLRNLSAGGTYQFADKWSGLNLMSGDVRQGLPIMGYTENTNPNTAETSRPGGKAVYSKVTLQLSRVQNIYKGLSLAGLLSGQWAFNPLLASEQYAYGGSQLGRGYDPAELIGDRGLGGSLELRYNKEIGRLFRNIEFYVFYDVGEIWNILTNSTTPGKISATSAGCGIRANMTKYWSANLFIAQPLTKQVAAEELIGDGWNLRGFFSLIFNFDA